MQQPSYPLSETNSLSLVHHGHLVVLDFMTFWIFFIGFGLGLYFGQLLAWFLAVRGYLWYCCWVHAGLGRGPASNRSSHTAQGSVKLPAAHCLLSLVFDAWLEVGLHGASKVGAEGTTWCIWAALFVNCMPSILRLIGLLMNCLVPSVLGATFLVRGYRSLPCVLWSAIQRGKGGLIVHPSVLAEPEGHVREFYEVIGRLFRTLPIDRIFLGIFGSYCLRLVILMYLICSSHLPSEGAHFWISWMMVCWWNLSRAAV